MATTKKAKRLWVYLNEEDQGRLLKLVEAVGTLNEVAILTTLVSAGLKACEEAGVKMPLPLRFEITAPAEAFDIYPNDPVYLVLKKYAAGKKLTARERGQLGAWAKKNP